MREHYAIVLNVVGDGVGLADEVGPVKVGGPVTIFVGHIILLEGLKDGTCNVHLANGPLLRVRESEETIVNKAKGHNVIVRIS